MVTRHLDLRRLVFIAMVLSLGCGTNESPSKSPVTSNGVASPGPEIRTAELTISDDVMPRVSAPVLSGKVMKVIDGDSILVLNQYRKSVTVQLRGVDAPELAQKYGETSLEQLRERIEGKIVTLQLDAPDEFSRLTAEVLLAGESINVWLIRTGCGWHNWKFDSDPAKAIAEKRARGDRVGLWAADDPIAPWEWKNPPDDGKLYIQGNGKCYHRANCRTLDSRRTEISLDVASESHEPCRVCEPPVK